MTTEPKAIAKVLDSAEDAFRLDWGRLLLRYMTSLTSSRLEANDFRILPLIEMEMRAAVKNLAKATKGAGKTHATNELGARFALAPEDPLRADLLATGLLAQIPVEAKRIVEETLEEGGGINEAMRGLRIQFPSWARHKQERIARTVASFYYNRGRLDVFREAGVQYYRVSEILDSRICPVCFGVHGLIIAIDSRLGVWPPLHWSCRGFSVPVLTPPDVGVIRTRDQLQRAADRRLREADFILGKKRITTWPGVPDGWGEIPPALLISPAEPEAPDWLPGWVQELLDIATTLLRGLRRGIAG